MKRVAVALAVAVGFTATSALARTPAWTAKGTVTALNRHSITVHGTTCRITNASPVPATIRLYYVGAGARIACAKGVLRSIDVLHAPTLFVSSQQPLSPTATGSAPSTSIETLGGRFAVTTVGPASITAGAGSINLTCVIGDGSPDVSGLQLGEPLTRMECRNGVLTSLTRAS